jgi:hypothetical protein
MLVVEELQKHEIDKVSLISYGERDLIIGGNKMEKFFGMPIYWLGWSIGKLSEAMNPLASIGSVAGIALTVRSNVEVFNSTIQGFPLSKAAAAEIVGTINSIFTQEKLQHPNDLIPETDQGILNVNIYSFQAVFYTEFSQSNIFYVSQKRAYDMTVLINQGQNVLSRDTINLLGASKDDVINDIREATKCLAFDIPTAVGFHLYRAMEAIIVKDYFTILHIPPQKNKNLGNYIKLLGDKGIDVKITAMLMHIKDHYRNPISHPEEFWDSDKAENAFGHATSIINVMVHDIDEIKKKGAVVPTP